MVKKLQKMAERKASSSTAAADSELAATIKGSANQIWLAGLGAFAKAQEEGGKIYEALVKEGARLQKRTQATAEDRIGGVTDKMSHMADGITGKAGQHWDKLESIFEERVARAQNKLGVPSRKDYDTLVARIDALAAAVDRLSGSSSARPAATRKPRAAASKAGAVTSPAARTASRKRPAGAAIAAPPAPTPAPALAPAPTPAPTSRRRAARKAA